MVSAVRPGIPSNVGNVDAALAAQRAQQGVPADESQSQDLREQRTPGILRQRGGAARQSIDAQSGGGSSGTAGAGTAASSPPPAPLAPLPAAINEAYPTSAPPTRLAGGSGTEASLFASSGGPSAADVVAGSAPVSRPKSPGPQMISDVPAANPFNDPPTTPRTPEQQAWVDANAVRANQLGWTVHELNQAGLMTGNRALSQASSVLNFLGSAWADANNPNGRGVSVSTGGAFASMVGQFANSPELQKLGHAAVGVDNAIKAFGKGDAVGGGIGVAQTIGTITGSKEISGVAQVAGGVQKLVNMNGVAANGISGAAGVFSGAGLLMGGETGKVVSTLGSAAGNVASIVANKIPGAAATGYAALANIGIGLFVKDPVARGIASSVTSLIGGALAGGPVGWGIGAVGALASILGIGPKRGKMGDSGQDLYADINNDGVFDKVYRDNDNDIKVRHGAQGKVALTLDESTLGTTWDRGNTLAMNQLLGPGQTMTSTNGRYMAKMEEDGNLVVYDKAGANETTPPKAIWQSNTAGFRASSLMMQGDGNLATYRPSPEAGKFYAAWNTGPAPAPPVPQKIWVATSGPTAGQAVALADERDASLAEGSTKVIRQESTVGGGRMGPRTIVNNVEARLVQPNGRFWVYADGERAGKVVVGMPPPDAAVADGTTSTRQESVSNGEGMDQVQANIKAVTLAPVPPPSNDFSLVLQDDGALVVHRGPGGPTSGVWSSGSSAGQVVMPGFSDVVQKINNGGLFDRPSQRSEMEVKDFDGDGFVDLRWKGDVQLNDGTGRFARKIPVAEAEATARQREAERAATAAQAARDYRTSQNQTADLTGNGVLDFVRRDPESDNAFEIEAGQLDTVTLPLDRRTVNRARELGSELGDGRALLAGQTMTSENGQWQLALQRDGNLVLRDLKAAPDAPPAWQSNTAGQGADVLMVSPSGNMATYRATDVAGRFAPAWVSNGVPAEPQGPVTLKVQDDGRISITRGAGGQAPAGEVWNSTQGAGAAVQSAASGRKLRFEDASAFDEAAAGRKTLVVADFRSVGVKDVLFKNTLYVNDGTGNFTQKVTVDELKQLAAMEAAAAGANSTSGKIGNQVANASAGGAALGVGAAQPGAPEPERPGYTPYVSQMTTGGRPLLSPAQERSQKAMEGLNAMRDRELRKLNTDLSAQSQQATTLEQLTGKSLAASDATFVALRKEGNDLQAELNSLRAAEKKHNAEAKKYVGKTFSPDEAAAISARLQKSKQALESRSAKLVPRIESFTGRLTTARTERETIIGNHNAQMGAINGRAEQLNSNFERDYGWLMPIDPFRQQPTAPGAGNANGSPAAGDSAVPTQGSTLTGGGNLTIDPRFKVGAQADGTPGTALDLSAIDTLDPGRIEGFSTTTLAQPFAQPVGSPQSATPTKARGTTTGMLPPELRYVHPVPSSTLLSTGDAATGQGDGRIGADRGNGTRRHMANDYAAARGAEVVSARDSVVIDVYDSEKVQGYGKGFGRTVVTYDEATHRTQVYAHLDDYEVKVGQTLRAGQRLGAVGDSGNARGMAPHLHFSEQQLAEGQAPGNGYVGGTGALLGTPLDSELTRKAAAAAAARAGMPARGDAAQKVDGTRRSSTSGDGRADIAQRMNAQNQAAADWLASKGASPEAVAHARKYGLQTASVEGGAFVATGTNGGSGSKELFKVAGRPDDGGNTVGNPNSPSATLDVIRRHNEAKTAPASTSETPSEYRGSPGASYPSSVPDGGYGSGDSSGGYYEPEQPAYTPPPLSPAEEQFERQDGLYRTTGGVKHWIGNPDASGNRTVYQLNKDGSINRNVPPRVYAGSLASINNTLTKKGEILSGKISSKFLFNSPTPDLKVELPKTQPTGAFGLPIPGGSYSSDSASPGGAFASGLNLPSVSTPTTKVDSFTFSSLPPLTPKTSALAGTIPGTSIPNTFTFGSGQSTTVPQAKPETLQQSIANNWNFYVQQPLSNVAGGAQQNLSRAQQALGYGTNAIVNSPAGKTVSNIVTGTQQNLVKLGDTFNQARDSALDAGNKALDPARRMFVQAPSNRPLTNDERQQANNRAVYEIEKALSRVGIGDGAQSRERVLQDLRAQNITGVSNPDRVTALQIDRTAGVSIGNERPTVDVYRQDGGALVASVKAFDGTTITATGRDDRELGVALTNDLARYELKAGATQQGAMRLPLRQVSLSPADADDSGRFQDVELFRERTGELTALVTGADGKLRKISADSEAELRESIERYARDVRSLDLAAAQRRLGELESRVKLSDMQSARALGGQRPADLSADRALRSQIIGELSRIGLTDIADPISVGSISVERPSYTKDAEPVTSARAYRRSDDQLTAFVIAADGKAVVATGKDQTELQKNLQDRLSDYEVRRITATGGIGDERKLPKVLREGQLRLQAEGEWNAKVAQATLTANGLERLYGVKLPGGAADPLNMKFLERVRKNPDEAVRTMYDGAEGQLLRQYHNQIRLSEIGRDVGGADGARKDDLFGDLRLGGRSPKDPSGSFSDIARTRFDAGVGNFAVDTPSRAPVNMNATAFNLFSALDGATPTGKGPKVPSVDDRAIEVGKLTIPFDRNRPTGKNGEAMEFKVFKEANRFAVVTENARGEYEKFTAPTQQELYRQLEQRVVFETQRQMEQGISRQDRLARLPASNLDKLGAGANEALVNFTVPLDGLASVISGDGKYADNSRWRLNQSQFDMQARGIDRNDPLVAAGRIGTSLALTVGGTGLTFKVLGTLGRGAAMAGNFVGLPAVNRIGSERVEGKLGTGTVTRVLQDVVLGVVSERLGGRSFVSQGVSGFTVDNVAQAAQDPTAFLNKSGFDLLEEALNNVGGEGAADFGARNRRGRLPAASPELLVGGRVTLPTSLVLPGTGSGEPSGTVRTGTPAGVGSGEPSDSVTIDVGDWGNSPQVASKAVASFRFDTPAVASVVKEVVAKTLERFDIGDRPEVLQGILPELLARSGAQYVPVPVPASPLGANAGDGRTVDTISNTFAGAGTRGTSISMDPGFGVDGFGADPRDGVFTPEQRRQMISGERQFISTGFEGFDQPSFNGTNTVSPNPPGEEPPGSGQPGGDGLPPRTVETDARGRIVLPPSMSPEQAQRYVQRQPADFEFVYRGADGREQVLAGQMPPDPVGATGEGFGLRGRVAQLEASGSTVGATPGAQLLTYVTPEGAPLGRQLLERMEQIEQDYDVRFQLGPDNIAVYRGDELQGEVLDRFSQTGLDFSFSGGFGTLTTDPDVAGRIVEAVGRGLDSTETALRVDDARRAETASAAEGLDAIAGLRGTVVADAQRTPVLRSANPANGVREPC